MKAFLKGNIDRLDTSDFNREGDDAIPKAMYAMNYHSVHLNSACVLTSNDKRPATPCSVATGVGAAEERRATQACAEGKRKYCTPKGNRKKAEQMASKGEVPR